MDCLVRDGWKLQKPPKWLEVPNPPNQKGFFFRRPKCSKFHPLSSSPSIELNFFLLGSWMQFAQSWRGFNRFFRAPANRTLAPIIAAGGWTNAMGVARCLGIMCAVALGVSAFVATQMLTGNDSTMKKYQFLGIRLNIRC